MAIPASGDSSDNRVIDLRAENNQQSICKSVYYTLYQSVNDTVWPNDYFNNQSYTDLVKGEQKTLYNSCFFLLIAVYVGSILVFVITIYSLRHLFLSHKNTTPSFNLRRFVKMLDRNRAGLEDIFERLGLSRQVNQQECMRYEILRLHTFHNWPKATPVFPTQLARSGFYYTGYDDQIECFRCRGRIVQWDRGDKPHKEHRRLFPNCPIVTGTDDLNVPLDIKEDMDPARIAEVLRVSQLYPLSRNRTTAQTSQSTLNSSATPETPVAGNEPSRAERSHDHAHEATSPAQTENNESYTEPSDSHNANSEAGLTRSNRSRDQEIARSSGSSGETTLDSLTTQPSSGPSSYSTRGVMKIEQNRLNTFRQWPKRQLIEPRLMSGAGLYFVGPNDKVKCAFCEGAMMNWDAGDDPHDEHFRYFGDRCAFIRGEEVGNVPLPGSNPNISPRRTQHGMSSNQARTFEQLGIITDRPRQPTMAREADRLATFGSWPTNKQQTPESLAQAGFYFTGLNDQVRCFYCDVGLRNWEPQDEPWIEHARWFPKCGFLKQTKGTAFIHEANRNAALVQPGSSVNNVGTRSSHGNNSGTPPPSDSRTEFDPRLVAAQMSTNKVQLVLNMGFPRNQVKSIIENRLRTTGQPFPSAESLLDAVMGSNDHSESTASAPAPGQADQRPAAVEMQQSSGSEGGEDLPQTPGGAMNGLVTSGHTEQQTGEEESSNATKKRKKRNRKKKNGASSNQERQGEETPSHLPNEDALIQENQMLRDQRLCKICLDNESEVVFLPCGHLVSCSSCAPNLRNCPMCRALIRGTVKAFLS